MKRTVCAAIGVIALGVFFGVASARSADGGIAWLVAAGRAGIAITVFGVFFLALPRWFKLPMQIFLAMVAGVLAGWMFKLAGAEAFAVDYLNIFGAMFILLLKLVITPLIFVSIICGVSGIGDPRKLGSVGFKAIAYYVCTTAMAVLIGLFCVNTIRPGAGRSDLQLSHHDVSSSTEIVQEDRPLGQVIQEDALPTIINNPIMAGQNPLAVIFLAILLGGALASLGDRARPAIEVFRVLDKALIQLVLWIMYLAPIGVFTLMSKAIAELGIEYLASLAWYVVTVVTGLGLHFAFLVCIVLVLAARVSPLRFLKGIAPALELSFSTSSSSATLPVSIDCTSRRIGADENVTNFMLPIGATVNMDGTALYQAVAVLFIAQVLNKDLTIAQQFGVFLSAIMVSIGTAGIPGGSVALMPLVLKQAGIGAEYIGIVIGVDRFLDMCRTVVNITGDSIGAIVVSRSEGAPIVPRANSDEYEEGAYLAD